MAFTLSAQGLPIHPQLKKESDGVCICTYINACLLTNERQRPRGGCYPYVYYALIPEYTNWHDPRRVGQLILHRNKATHKLCSVQFHRHFGYNVAIDYIYFPLPYKTNQENIFLLKPSCMKLLKFVLYCLFLCSL